KNPNGAMLCSCSTPHHTSQTRPPGHGSRSTSRNTLHWRVASWGLPTPCPPGEAIIPAFAPVRSETATQAACLAILQRAQLGGYHHSSAALHTLRGEGGTSAVRRSLSRYGSGSCLLDPHCRGVPSRLGCWSLRREPGRVGATSALMPFRLH